MALLDDLAEQRIQEAQQRGDLDDLAGAGQRLELDDDSLVPEHLRAAYRVLRNAGYLPPELHTRREIRDVEDLLRSLPESAVAERSQAHRRLEALRMRLEGARRGRGLLWTEDGAYAERLVARFRRGSDS